MNQCLSLSAALIYNILALINNVDMFRFKVKQIFSPTGSVDTLGPQGSVLALTCIVNNWRRRLDGELNLFVTSCIMYIRVSLGLSSSV